MNKQYELPSGWKLGQTVSVVFPDNGTLRNCKIVKVSFTEHSEPLYDLEVPFSHHDYDGDTEESSPMKTGFARLHGLRQWFLSYTQEEWDKINTKINLVD